MNTIREELIRLADAKYRTFHSALLPGTDNLIGVRIPILRQLAKEMIRCDDWRAFADSADLCYYEETMLQGMVTALATMEWEERVRRLSGFVPRIDNWAVCDVVCGDLKGVVRKERLAVWQFIQPYLRAGREFERRFGIVMLFHYVDEDHIDQLLAYADTFDHPAYYARMAMAWLLSICFVKFPVQTMDYFRRSKLDAWTYNKAIQKTRESLRVDKATKRELERMKIKPHTD
ncbi:MAG: DNA alkylation repair protein [Mediterranea sp.]|jgi:3-methyladenine DNA glycosylase AlkD|nr:DNA alkylation repair protein [Mediterranea sp.]